MEVTGIDKQPSFCNLESITTVKSFVIPARESLNLFAIFAIFLRLYDLDDNLVKLFSRIS
jgi:hypothetical protein